MSKFIVYSNNDPHDARRWQLLTPEPGAPVPVNCFKAGSHTRETIARWWKKLAPDEQVRITWLHTPNGDATYVGTAINIAAWFGQYPLLAYAIDTISIADGADVTSTLDARGKNYGKFAGVAEITENLMAVARKAPSYEKMTPTAKVALFMILHKTARVLNGNPEYVDNWHDIAGYATLQELELKGEGK